MTKTGKSNPLLPVFIIIAELFFTLIFTAELLIVKSASNSFLPFTTTL